MQLHSLNALFKKKIFLKISFWRLYLNTCRHIWYLFSDCKGKKMTCTYISNRRSRLNKSLPLCQRSLRKWKVQITTNLLLNRFFPFFLSMHIVLASFFFQNVILNQILTSLFIQIEILQRFYSVYRNIFDSFS